MFYDLYHSLADNHLLLEYLDRPPKSDDKAKYNDEQERFDSDAAFFVGGLFRYLKGLELRHLLL